jgi:anthranilate/para-aminobenzoate synthase component II
MRLLPMQAPLHHIRGLHSSLNGVILPGGNSGGSYPAAVALLVNLTLEAAAASQRAEQVCSGALFCCAPFCVAYLYGSLRDIWPRTTQQQVPLWGICLGFEMLSWNVARNRSVCTGKWGGLLLPLPLSVSASSRMFGGISARMRQVMATRNVTMHNHGGGVAPDEFESNEHLRATFDVTSTATGRSGRTFANVIEGKNGLQIYGTIWHPEMPMFEHEVSARILGMTRRS